MDKKDNLYNLLYFQIHIFSLILMQKLKEQFCNKDKFAKLLKFKTKS